MSGSLHLVLAWFSQWTLQIPATTAIDGRVQRLHRHATAPQAGVMENIILPEQIGDSQAEQKAVVDEAVVDEDGPATEDETRATLLERAKRPFAVILNEFVQVPKSKDPLQSRIGPLATFVNRGDLRALRAYLLLAAIISSGDSDDGFSTTLPLGAWARAFDTTRHADTRAASAAASKTIGRLVDRKVIARSRKGRERKVSITLLRPNGSGEPFIRKEEDGKLIPYFPLSNVFWTEGWWNELDLPATAMLLVSLHEKSGEFKLPTENFPKWYGWSADTAERGLKKLVELGILEKTQKLTKAPLSPTGQARVNVYRVLPPFAKNNVADVS